VFETEEEENSKMYSIIERETGETVDTFDTMDLAVAAMTKLNAEIESDEAYGVSPYDIIVNDVDKYLESLKEE
jgi:hypothetical protein